MKISRALISVWDKTGLSELVGFLHKHDIEIIATGGTQKTLEKSGIPVTPIETITGLPPIMGGRVKTISPKIFGGILADRDQPSHLEDLEQLNAIPIDLVVVNFYPFVSEAAEKNLEFRKAIEYIDIGGPSMVRAAAKNYHSVVPLCDPKQYPRFMEQFTKNDGRISIEFRQRYARDVFKMTAVYEAAIMAYFSKSDHELLPETLNITATREQQIRYGENPHQKAAFYRNIHDINHWHQFQGKKLSFNNYSDIDSTIRIINEFTEPACVIVKHANPCGFGTGQNGLEAFHRAVATDPVSYFGGIVGFNREVPPDLALALIKPFLECVTAPSFTNEALRIFTKKKNLRVIRFDKDQQNGLVLKSCSGGYLVQERDRDQHELEHLKIVTKRPPSNSELISMRLGWIISKYVKSNSIVLSDYRQVLGVGAGQMSRVDSVKIAVRKSQEAGLSLAGAIIASDAFFPFPDSLEIAAGAGITAVIQPGGSIKDDDVINRADELNMAMVFTGIRHFYH